MFVFVSLAFGDSVSFSVLIQHCELPMFSSKEFRFFHFTFKSLIFIELRPESEYGV